MNNYCEQRINMVKNQVMPNHVHQESLIDRMMEIPKHLFVEDKYQAISYADKRISVGEGRELLAPEVFARMVQELNLTGEEVVLDIGCGTGYSTAILAGIAADVVAVESNQILAVKAANLLGHLQIVNITIKHAELLSGAPELAPYDAILVNGVLAEEPRNLLTQLSHDGCLITLLKMPNGLVKAVKYQNNDGHFQVIELFDAHANLLR